MRHTQKTGGGAGQNAVPGVERAADGQGGTIAAVATAAGRAGIGIIRISGKEALSIAQNIFKPARQPGSLTRQGLFEASPHRLTYGHIFDPNVKEAIDEVLLAVMPAPHSYTREDVVEIQCHGGNIVMQRVIELVLRLGARLAEPGEFTRRAFLNGRIDLTQAEAVADLINARSEGALKLASRLLGGELKARIQAILDAITDQLALLEADLEFGEDGVDGVGSGEVSASSLTERVIVPMRLLVDGYRFGRILREGMTLAIVGRPNVGKSSLLNRLVDKEKAIVTPFPGTTRDPVEATTCIDGVEVKIIDTAGLRESLDPVERIGIGKAREALQAADLVLLLIEAQTPPGAEDDKILAQIQGREFLLVVNKCDLLEDGRSPGLPERYAPGRPIHVSAKTGQGIDRVKSAIGAHWGQGTAEQLKEALVSELRHKICIDAALQAAQQAADRMRENRSATDMVAMDLQHAMIQIQGIIGRSTGTEVLDSIFKKFCIGK